MLDKDKTIHKNQKLKRVVIKEEMVAVTGNAINALILNQMVYWTEILNKADQETQKEIEQYKKIGMDHKVEKLEAQLRNGWFWKSAKELSDELMDISSRATIDRKLRELVDAGFLETKKNEENKFDKKNHYKVNIDFLRRELKKLGYALEGYAIPDDEPETPESSNAQNEQSEETLILSNAQNEQSGDQYEHSDAPGEQTYTEITSEITSETTFKDLVNKEIQNFCNDHYTEFANTRWTKKQWLTIVKKFADEFIENKKYKEVPKEKWGGYVYSSLKTIAYKHDLKHEKVEGFRKWKSEYLNQEDYEEMPY